MNPEADKPQTPQTPEQAAGLPDTAAPAPQSDKQAAKVDSLAQRFKAMPSGKRIVLVALVGLVAAAIIAAVALALSGGDASKTSSTSSAKDGGTPATGAKGQSGTSAQNGDKAATANPPSSAVNTNPSAGSTITMKGMAFSPATLNVAKNTVVTWKNDDTVAHAIDKAAGQASGPHSPQLKPGASYSYSFTAAGTYKYVCVIHPSMSGTVVVKD